MKSYNFSWHREAEECVPISMLQMECAICGRKIDGTMRSWHEGPVIEFSFEAISNRQLSWAEVCERWPTDERLPEKEGFPTMHFVTAEFTGELFSTSFIGRKLVDIPRVHAKQ